MDILDIDEVLKDDSFLCFEGKTHDDVVNILRQWKQNNQPLLSSFNNNNVQHQQENTTTTTTTTTTGATEHIQFQPNELQLGEYRNHGDKINTRTFTRPKRKTFIALDMNTPVLADVQHGMSLLQLQESILKPKIDGYVTPKAMLHDISPPSSINVMTPLIHKSMLQDTSPPLSICSSIDKSIDNSLITSADFSSISFLQTPNCYTLQDMISDRQKLELLTLSSDDGTLLKDINIGQIDDISLQSKQTSSCSTMANSTDSLEVTIVYAANEKTFDVDATNTLKNNSTFNLKNQQQQQKEKEEQQNSTTTNIMEQTVCLSNNSCNEETSSPDNLDMTYSCKISTPLHDRLQQLDVELSPIDKNGQPVENLQSNTFDLSTTPTSHVSSSVQSVENTIESQLKAHLLPHVYNNLTFSRLAHRQKDQIELNAKRSALFTQNYNDQQQQQQQQLDDLDKTCLSVKEEKTNKQPPTPVTLKKQLNVSADECYSPQRAQSNTSNNERLLGRRSRLYDDINLNTTNSNETEAETESESVRKDIERMDRRQQSRNRFKTIKLAKTRGENVPCIDDCAFEDIQSERVPQQQQQQQQHEQYYENSSSSHLPQANNRQLSKIYRKNEVKPSMQQQQQHKYESGRNLRGLYDFSAEKANSAHNLDATAALQRDRSKSREKSAALGIKSKSYTNLTKPELTIKSITNTLQQVADSDQNLNTADNTFKIMKPVSGLRAPCSIRPPQQTMVHYRSQPASGIKSELHEPDDARAYGINTKIQAHKNPVSGIPKLPSSRLPSTIKRSGLPRPTSTTRR